MKHLKAILFDLDGTLLNSIEPILTSFSYIFSTYLPHKTYSQTQMIERLGTTLHQQMMTLSDGDEPLAIEMVRAYRAHNLVLMENCPLYPETKETLQSLKERGHRMGIVTSKGKQSAEFSLRRHQLAPLFEVFLTSEDTSQHKPHPEPLFEATRRMKLTPQEVAYVGDATHDIHCAKAAGSVSVAALWGPSAPETLRALKPDHALSRIEDLLALL